MKKYDVLVVGGGTAGMIAAIQSGREGASTLLVEKNGILGGTMTLGGIDNPAQFFAWGRQVVGGIGWELCRKTLEETGRPVPAPEAAPRHIRINAPVFAALADEAVLNAGVEVLFHAMPASASFTGGGWDVQICTKSGLRKIRAQVLVDATGDANVVEMAGFEVVRPNIIQPATLSFQCSGYDPDSLDYEALKTASDAAIAAGEILTTDLSWGNNGPKALLRRRGHNANHVRAPSAQTSEGRSQAEFEGRQALLRLYRFLRKQPGLENFHIDWVCPEIGIRETVVIKGKQTVSLAEYESGKVYDDAVCQAFYQIDEHRPDGKRSNCYPLKDQIVPTIPRGALLPAGSRFLLVAGRCLSSDHVANSALRVECPCMAMGQAAGVMAALSARTGVDPEQLPLDEVRRLLRKHGAIMPGDYTS